MRFLNQDTENLILQELFNLNHKIDNYQESTQRQFEELRGEIKTIKETMATKEDLKNFATKEDLKNFATKEDLKKFPTKEDIKKFATKEELKREMSDVSQIFKDTFGELQRRENNLRLELFEKVN